MSIGDSVGVLMGDFVHRLVGWSAGWLVGWLVGCHFLFVLHFALCVIVLLKA